LDPDPGPAFDPSDQIPLHVDKIQLVRPDPDTVHQSYRRSLCQLGYQRKHEDTRGIFHSIDLYEHLLSISGQLSSHQKAPIPAFLPPCDEWLSCIPHLLPIASPGIRSFQDCSESSLLTQYQPARQEIIYTWPKIIVVLKLKSFINIIKIPVKMRMYDISVWHKRESVEESPKSLPRFLHNLHPLLHLKIPKILFSDSTLFSDANNPLLRKRTPDLTECGSGALIGRNIEVDSPMRVRTIIGQQSTKLSCRVEITLRFTVTDQYYALRENGDWLPTGVILMGFDDSNCEMRIGKWEFGDLGFVRNGSVNENILWAEAIMKILDVKDDVRRFGFSFSTLKHSVPQEGSSRPPSCCPAFSRLSSLAPPVLLPSNCNR
uniref:Uncharacterized protein n=1 Tax=Cucumis melo TaxID=3656 RepID=A0A9I9E669_CUCME